MELLLSYEEYCELIGVSFLEGEEPPIWFEPTQRIALTVIVNNLAQSHLFPLNLGDFLSLKSSIKSVVASGIAYQIKFIQEHPELFNDSLIGNTSLGIGQFSKGPLNARDVMYSIKHLSPNSRTFFESIGWLWGSLNRKLKRESFYGAPGHPVAEWGYLFGDISSQKDLMDLIAGVTGYEPDGTTIELNGDEKLSLKDSSDYVKRAALDLKANKEDVVDKTTDQLISGTKTFTNHIKIPAGVSSDDGVNFNQLSKKANQDDVVLLKTNQEIIGEKTFFGTAHLDGGMTSKINGEKVIDFVDGIKLIKNDTSTNPQVYQKNAEGLLEPFLAEHVQDIVSLSKLNIELAKVVPRGNNVDRVIREGTVYITNSDGNNLLCNQWTMTGSQDPNILFKELKDDPQLYKLELDVNVGIGSGLGTFPKMIVSPTNELMPKKRYVLSYIGFQGGQGSIMFTCGVNGIVYPLSGTFNGMITGTFQDDDNRVCDFAEMSSNFTFDWRNRRFLPKINGYSINDTDFIYHDCYISPNISSHPSAAPDTIGLKYRIWKKAELPQ